MFQRPRQSCIDLILTNIQKRFQNFSIIETGLSDFHKLTVTVLKSYFRKNEPKKLINHNFKNVSNQQFRTEHVKELSESNVNARQFDSFQTISLGILNKFVNLNYS